MEWSLYVTKQRENGSTDSHNFSIITFVKDCDFLEHGMFDKEIDVYLTNGQIWKDLLELT